MIGDVKPKFIQLRHCPENYFIKEYYHFGTISAPFSALLISLCVGIDQPSSWRKEKGSCFVLKSTLDAVNQFWINPIFCSAPFKGSHPSVIILVHEEIAHGHDVAKRIVVRQEKQRVKQCHGIVRSSPHTTQRWYQPPETGNVSHLGLEKTWITLWQLSGKQHPPPISFFISPLDFNSLNICFIPHEHDRNWGGR